MAIPYESAAAIPASPATHRILDGATTLRLVYAVLFASVSVMVGVLWDISWHMSIGRDSFFTPAHLAIYLGGVVAGFACGGLALAITFRGSDADRSATVRFWRFFHAPLGAWVAIWGSFAMITSGPFDDWWHNAYGLDVEILSPPHVLLALGIVAIQVGALLMVLSQQNRAAASDTRFRWLYAFAAGILLVMVATMASEYTTPNHWHRARTYKILAAVLPVFIVAVGRAGRLKWPATAMVLFYWLGVSVTGWILQLFPAEPMLAPIFNPVDHMVAPRVPLMLLPVGLGVDLVMQRWGSRSDWLLAPVLGVVFGALLIGTLWFWGAFILSPAARNWFFMADQWAYQAQLGDWRYEFWGAAGDPVFRPAALAWVGGLGIVSTRLGLWWGNWMARVKR